MFSSSSTIRIDLATPILLTLTPSYFARNRLEGRMWPPVGTLNERGRFFQPAVRPGGDHRGMTATLSRPTVAAGRATPQRGARWRLPVGLGVFGFVAAFAG